MQLKLNHAILAAMLLSSGCASSLFNVNLNVVGEQTALEKQVLGTYKSLGEDLMIYSSVRGVDEGGALKTPPPATASQRAACLAMKNREYNRDDVIRILRAGIAGEANTGLLTARAEAAALAIEGLTREQVMKIIDEENRDRAAVIERLVATTPGISKEQTVQVGRIFAGLNQDVAPGGAWIQNEDETWRRK